MVNLIRIYQSGSGWTLQVDWLIGLIILFAVFMWIERKEK